MQLVFVKVNLMMLDDMRGFFRKLRRFVGDFRIEQQDMCDQNANRMTISFYTDKVKFNEGELKYVDLEARRNDKGSWYFTRITK